MKLSAGQVFIISLWYWRFNDLLYDLPAAGILDWDETDSFMKVINPFHFSFFPPLFHLTLWMEVVHYGLRNQNSNEVLHEAVMETEGCSAGGFCKRAGALTLSLQTKYT